MRDFLTEVTSPVMSDLSFDYRPEDVSQITGGELDVLYEGSEFVISGELKHFDVGIVKRSAREKRAMPALITAEVCIYLNGIL